MSQTVSMVSTNSVKAVHAIGDASIANTIGIPSAAPRVSTSHWCYSDDGKVKASDVEASTSTSSFLQNI